MGQARATVETTTQLVELVYELLDAHDDTSRLARGYDGRELSWAAHLDYLQRLQRLGREMLAAGVE